jgi:hypothetical protein
MMSFLNIPVDIPWWVALAIAVPGAIYGLLLLAMPFGVFGLKSRLAHIESQLEDIRVELQTIAIGLSMPGCNSPAARATTLKAEPMPEDPRTTRPQQPVVPARRTEPRLDWRR